MRPVASSAGRVVAPVLVVVAVGEEGQGDGAGSAPAAANADTKFSTVSAA